MAFLILALSTVESSTELKCPSYFGCPVNLPKNDNQCFFFSIGERNSFTLSLLVLAWIQALNGREILQNCLLDCLTCGIQDDIFLKFGFIVNRSLAEYEPVLGIEWPNYLAFATSLNLVSYIYQPQLSFWLEIQRSLLSEKKKIESSLCPLKRRKSITNNLRRNKLNAIEGRNQFLLACNRQTNAILSKFGSLTQLKENL